MANLTAHVVTKGLSRPVFATAPPGDMSRLFIVEQHTGLIRILDLATGLLKPAPFLQVTGLETGNEQGLLGLTFHPHYASNGLFFVSFTDSPVAVGAAATHIRRYKVSADPDSADLATAAKVLKFDRPFANHCGGWIGFSPRDGFLYIASGDGGNETDPGRHGQDLSTLLGKMLRIDVDRNDFSVDDTRAYGIPPTNPFVNRADRPGARPEIWAYGLRNPWRCSFDRQTGDLWMGDVGQDLFEEIDFQPVSSKGGENYGWRIREGKHATEFGKNDTPGADPFVDPVFEYSHLVDGGVAVIGGYVYRGTALPALTGTFLFADVNGTIKSFRSDGRTVTDLTDHTADRTPAEGFQELSSFAEDGAGELYLLDLLGGSLFVVEGQ